ncbi:hypothetical protein E4U52_008360 [Claviceps spartinae]|nr:hypothetical protein E4U52_008360 [Claviceps spartinae]
MTYQADTRLPRDRDDGTFCDLEIDCGERRFRAHRNVVCLHSPVIRAAFFGKWEKEPTCGVFEIKEPSHMLVRRMLDYIYTGDYDDFNSSILVRKDHLSPEDVAKLEISGQVPLHVKMMDLGETYLLKSYMDTPHGRYHRVKTASAPAQEHNKYLVRTIAKQVSNAPAAKGSPGPQRQGPANATQHNNADKFLPRDWDDTHKAFCDLEIVCGERRFAAHRNVVCLHSSVIRAACLGPWKLKIKTPGALAQVVCRNPAAHMICNRRRPGAARGVFEIKETSPMLVRRMLDYIYTGGYDDFGSNILAQKDHLSPQEVAELDIADYSTMYLEMMELGDMYMVKGLGQLTSEKFAEYLASQTVGDILVKLLSSSRKFMPSESIRLTRFGKSSLTA